MPHVCEYLQRPEETFQLLWSSSYKKMWFGTTWEHHTTTYRKTIKHYQLLSHLSNPLFFNGNITSIGSLGLPETIL